jgi:hypothetical protein
MRFVIRCALAVIFMTVLLSAVVYAEDFSADMVSTSGAGSMTAKLYISGDKSRMEMPQAVTISRMDKKIVWVLVPAQKMYMEQKFDPRTAASTQEKIEGELERTAVGNEVLDGRNTTKYRVTFEAAGRTETLFQWIDESAHIPVKTAAIDGSWVTEFRSIQTGSQDPALFELPDGYTKMVMPDMSDMMNAMAKDSKQE